MKSSLVNSIALSILLTFGTASLSLAIINGKQDSHPRIVSLQGQNSSCKGILIDDEIVVTAAHCIGSGSNSIYVFSLQKYFPVKDFAVHSKFVSESNTFPNDVAVLLIKKIEDTAPLGPSIELPSKEIPIGAKVKTFGGTHTFEGLFNFESHKVSSANFVTTGFSSILEPSGKISVEPEFENDDYPVRICLGDSGGPSLATARNKTYLMGVTSILRKTLTDVLWHGSQVKSTEDCIHSSARIESMAYHYSWLIGAVKKLKDRNL